MKYTFPKISLGEFKEKSSIFYSVAQTVSSINDLKSKLSNVKGKYPDASHVCYAYRIKMGDRLDEFYSDAGEPKGSAGKPILNALKRNNLINSVIFVIRYFGGTKLGIPGLIHAYETAAEDAIENGSIQKWVQLERISFNYSYDLQKKVDAILQKFEVNIINADFGESIKMDIEVEVMKMDDISQQLCEISNGTINIKQGSLPANQI